MKNKVKILNVVLVVSILLFVGLCFLYMNNKETEEVLAEEEISLDMAMDDMESSSVEETEEEVIMSEEEPAFEEYDIKLMMVGDNLLHPAIIKTGIQEDGSLDYEFLFKDIEEYLELADIKMINQETILGGNDLGFSGYPYFNSPTEIGDSIAESGFNVVLHASNHAADMGLEGIINCASFWEKYPEVLMTGIYKDRDQEHEIPLLTIKDVTFAILNYTYGPNMETLPGPIQGHLDMLCNWDENTGRIDFTTLHPDVLTDIENASKIADVVIVCPHWGTEYTTQASSYQKEFAQQMTQAGADLILGTHPHSIQPVEWIESENGNRALCYYSLGNYVSTQNKEISMLGAMAWITFRVKEDGITIWEANTGVVPLVCHYRRQGLRHENVYLLEDYTQELADAHGIHTYAPEIRLRMEDLQRWSDETFGYWVLSAEQVLNNE